MSQNDGKHVTFINVFELAREDVDAFRDGWGRFAGMMASAPGFRGAQLHEAVSGETRFQLVNVAHWESEQAWRDAAANPAMKAAIEEAGGEWLTLAVQNTGLYRPAASFGGDV